VRSSCTTSLTTHYRTSCWAQVNMYICIYLCASYTLSYFWTLCALTSCNLSNNAIKELPVEFRFTCTYAYIHVLRIYIYIYIYIWTLGAFTSRNFSNNAIIEISVELRYTCTYAYIYVLRVYVYILKLWVRSPRATSLTTPSRRFLLSWSIYV